MFVGSHSPHESVTIDETERITTAMNAVRSIVRALRVSSRMIETKMGISGAQLFVLQQLSERAASSLNELAERTATHQSSVSVVVRRLVERGFVSRSVSRDDRRRAELALTESGRQLLSGAPVTVQVQLIQSARAMTSEQLTDLGALMTEWVKGAGLLTDHEEPPLMFDELPPVE